MDVLRIINSCVGGALELYLSGNPHVAPTHRLCAQAIQRPSNSEPPATPLQERLVSTGSELLLRLLLPAAGAADEPQKSRTENATTQLSFAYEFEIGTKE